MKLYYTSGVCSLSPHIVLSEGGFDFELEKVDLKTKVTSTGQDFNRINIKSSVPVLELDNGEILTEGVAIVQYLADHKPEAALAPANGTWERSLMQEWLNYISTEMHKSFGAIFHSEEIGGNSKEYFLKKIKKAFDYVSSKLENKQYLLGDQFTVADAYLFTVLRWHQGIKLDLTPWPALVAYQNRVAMRPKVFLALQREGLVQ